MRYRYFLMAAALLMPVSLIQATTMANATPYPAPTPPWRWLALGVIIIVVTIVLVTIMDRRKKK